MSADIGIFVFVVIPRSLLLTKHTIFFLSKLIFFLPLFTVIFLHLFAVISLAHCVLPVRFVRFVDVKEGVANFFWSIDSY